MKRHTLCLCACSAVSILSGATLYAQSPSVEQPNILVIILDDAGYNDFSFMGCPDFKTPHIDSIAQAGATLTDAHTSAAVSGPSRCGLLTGRYQQRGGYECNPGSTPDFGMNLQERSIGNVFQDAGYKTIAIGKWHQGNKDTFHPNERGFDEFYGFLGGSRGYFYKPTGADNPRNKDQMMQHNGQQVSFDQYLTYELGDQAVRYIQSVGEQPFMMYLSYNAVHSPYEADPKDMARFEGHPRQVLAAMTYAVDKSIGDVLSALKSTGKYDNTLIFFLSDNGGPPFANVCNYPLKGHKGNKYEGGHRVPFAVSFGDKITAGSRFDGLSSALDILPTAAAAAHIDVAQKDLPLDGVNLLPYLKGEKEGDPHSALFWRRDNVAAMRQGDYKFIRVEEVGSCLYNLADNIGELDDIAAQHPERVAQMGAALKEWEKGLMNPLLWNEQDWRFVTRERHRALMKNEEQTIIYPDQYYKAFGLEGTYKEAKMKAKEAKETQKKS